MPTRMLPFLAVSLAITLMISTLATAAELLEPNAEQEFHASMERLAVQSLIRKGAWEELYARSSSGLVLTPNDPTLLRGKIRALRQLGYGQAARKTVQQARLNHPTDSGLLLEQIWLEAIAGEWSQVLKNSEDAALITDADSELLLLRGISLREMGETAAALALFSRLLERNPADCISLTNRGRLLARSGQDSQALTDLTAAIVCSSQPDPFIARSALLLRNGKHAEALQDLNRALELSPSNLTALLARSEARLLVGDIAGAGQDLMVARETSPTDRRIEPLACRLGSASGDWKVVAECAEQSAKLTPNDPAAWRTLGKARLESGNLDGAVAAYDTLVLLANNDSRARLERATAQLLRRDYTAAAADCSAVIEQQPLAIAYALRSLAYYRAENLLQADEDSTNALALDHNEQTATLVRANLALARNDLKAATADCERVVQRAPKSPWGTTTCGLVYLQAGDLDKAASFAERARIIAPADPETKNLIAKITAVRANSGATPVSINAANAPKIPSPAKEK